MKPKKNPIEYIFMDNKVGMRLGNLTIVTKSKDKHLRNILCSELNIKGCVFGSKGERKKKKN